MKFARELIESNPEAKAEYDRLLPEFTLYRAQLEARRDKEKVDSQV
ncbi:MAG: hypothetical protein IID31_14150 [Planctomycetes bacterium]|nr:hypothetical protein [Planctomycetota bacterium]